MINKKSNELQVPTKPIDTLNTEKRGKSQIRSKSNIKQNKDENLRAQIEQLKEEAEVLRNNKNTDTFTSTETPKQNPKNVQMASA